MKPLFKKISQSLIVLFAMFISITACKKDKGPTVTLPVLSTLEVIGSSNANVQCGGDITSTGGGAITKFGIVLSSTVATPTLEAKDDFTEETNGDVGEFGANFTNLLVNKTYYVRAYATNAKGTAYGEKITFVIDASGNLYHTIKISTQTWLLENLKTTKYAGGADIPFYGLNGWANLNSDAMCWYAADAMVNKNLYGGLYNWYAVNQADPNKKLAPSGWRIPTVADWQTLNSNTADDLTKLGKELKEAGNAHWAPVMGITATNSTHFTALPGGYRDYDNELFSGLGTAGYFWTSGEDAANSLILYNRLNDNSDALKELKPSNTLKNLGLSVRCIKE